VVWDVKTFDQDIHDTRITDPHQSLVAAVDLLGHEIQAFARGTPPPDPERAFLQTVDGLEHAIDALVRQLPPPEPDRGLDRAAGVLADTIGRMVHDLPPLEPEHGAGAVLDALAHAAETLVHIGDVSPGPCRGLAEGIDTLAGTIDALADLVLVQPGPCRLLAQTIDALAQPLAQDESTASARLLDGTLGALAHAIDTLANPSPEPDRAGHGALQTLAHAIETFIHDSPPPEPDLALAEVHTLASTVESLADLVLVSPGPCRLLAGTLDALAHESPPSSVRGFDHALDALAHALDTLANPPPDPERAGDLATHTLAHALDTLVHDGFDNPPPEPEHGLVHAADALTHTIDGLLSPSPEPDHVLDHSIHNLAHTIDALVHTLPMIEPVAASAEESEYVAAVDAAIHAVDVALRGGPDAHAGLIPAVQSLAHAVGEIVPCIDIEHPDPNRGIDLALDTLARTVDFQAHQASVPEHDRALVAGIDALVHGIDLLTQHSGVTPLPGGGLDLPFV
jgi:hypothetical protein